MSSIIKKRRGCSLAVLLMAALIFGLACGTAQAAEKMEKKVVAAKPMANKPAEIKFADLGGIKDWRADGVNAMFIQALGGQWYRVTFFSQCFGLPWAERIAFVTTPDGYLDKFSSVMVNGQQCYFKNVEDVVNLDMYGLGKPGESK